jgi:diguanylate cyclase (GGDEF)-like protein
MMNGHNIGSTASQLVYRLAAAIAVLLTLAVTTFYFFVNLGFYQSALKVETDVTTRTIEDRISRNPSLWEFELLRLDELLRQRSRLVYDTSTHKTLYNAKHVAVLTVAAEQEHLWPLISESQSIYSNGVVIAQFEQSLSIRGLLERTGLVMASSAALFAGLFWIIYQVAFRRLHDADRKLQQMAWFDGLTSLPNRAQYKRMAERMIYDAKISHKEMAIFFIDLDHFKPVNDTHGHHIGDQLLQSVAQRIRKQCKGNDIVMRFGGDEFVVIANNTSAVKALRRCNSLVESLAEPFVLNNHTVAIGASAGISVYPYDAQTAHELLSNADIAMYQAKQAGRNRVMRYSLGMRDLLQERKQLEDDLKMGLEKGQFQLVYQALYNAKEVPELVGAEALLRWERSPGVTIQPSVFIPALEETGLIVSVGDWVIEQAIKQIVQWRKHELPHLRVSVNVAAVQLEDPALPGRVMKLLELHGVPPTQLRFEFTESALIADTPNTYRTIEALRNLGIALDVDDFGTGYSSFIYLKRYAISGVKIDRSFVNDMLDSHDDRVIVEGIIQFAHSLNLSVTAEGVENAAQLKMLRKMGCDYLQGFYFSKPVQPIEIEIHAKVA